MYTSLPVRRWGVAFATMGSTLKRGFVGSGDETASGAATKADLQRSLEGVHSSVDVPNHEAGFWQQWRAFVGPAILISVGYMPYLEKLKFNLVGYGCTTCIGNSGPLPTEVSQAIDEKDLVVASVLSGNRNFEGRINSEVRANYLMSPPLVVAFALAGRIDVDLKKDPLGRGKDGKPVYLSDVWPTQQEVDEAVQQISADMFHKSYGEVYAGDSQWRSLPLPKGQTYAWEHDSTYIRKAPYFDDMTVKPGAVEDIRGARVLAVLGDSVTTDHISPAGSIKKDSPAGKYLIEHGRLHPHPD